MLKKLFSLGVLVWFGAVLWAVVQQVVVARPLGSVVPGWVRTAMKWCASGYWGASLVIRPVAPVMSLAFRSSVEWCACAWSLVKVDQSFLLGPGAWCLDSLIDWRALNAEATPWAGQSVKMVLWFPSLTKKVPWAGQSGWMAWSRLGLESF